jgi:hypothetical protein
MVNVHLRTAVLGHVSREARRQLSSSAVRFACDSPLEGDGFEPSVPGLGGGWPAPIPSRA